MPEELLGRPDQAVVVRAAETLIEGVQAGVVQGGARLGVGHVEGARGRPRREQLADDLRDERVRGFMYAIVGRAGVASPVEQHLVQVVQVAVAVKAGLHAGVEPGWPVRGDGRGGPDTFGELPGELFLQREHQVILGREVRVEQSLGNAGGMGDVLK